MASTYLTHTTSTPTNSDKATLSFWLKRSKLSSGQGVFAQDTDGNDKFAFILGSNDTISIFQETAGTVDINLVTNRVFRDTSAWYNFVLHFDSTQGAGSNRVQLFVNGVQETSFSTATYPSSDVDFRFNKSGIVQEIGRYEGGNYFDGLLSHINFIDGTIYPASTFGSTDSTTGEWKINTSPSVTYGTNGFFILKDGNTITDSSTNSNNFSLGGGTLTKTESSPSNVFATFNPLFVYSSGKKPAYSNGNNTATFDNAGENEHSPSTLAPSSGKYYAEFKWVSSHGNGATGVGIFATDVNNNNDINAQSYLYMGDGNKRILNSSSSYGASWTTGDIISIALDCDNNTVTFYKNGATQGALSIASGNNYYMYCTDYDNKVVNANFGNGYFGTTAVSSAGTNASGNGIFEYDVPAGYTALSTKGLNL